MDITAEVKAAVSGKKAVVGFRQTSKALKTGKLKQVIIAANCPSALKEDLRRNAELSKIPLVQFAGSSVELGATCGKPFNISVLGIRK